MNNVPHDNDEHDEYYDNTENDTDLHDHHNNNHDHDMNHDNTATTTNHKDSTKDERQPLHHEAQHKTVPPSNPFVSRWQHPYASAKSMILMTSRPDHSRLPQLLPIIHNHPLIVQRRIEKKRLQLLQQLKSQQLQSQQSQKRIVTPSDWQEINALEDYFMSILQQLHPLQRRFVKMGLFDIPIWTLLLPCLLLALLYITPQFFQWHPLSHRHLKGRTCVMNLFVDKMEPNEFHPDLDSHHHHHKNNNHPKHTHHIDTAVDVTFTSSVSKSSYRTQKQIDIMSRFIGCVADSFRSHIHVEQAIVFAHVRDGGQLAQEALLHWPHRGEYSTQLHVMAAVADAGTTDKKTLLLNDNHHDNHDDLAVQELKQRFQHSGDSIHVYDGNRNTIDVQDDEVDTDDDEQQPVKVSQDRHRRQLSTVETPPSLLSLLIPDADDPPIIPYFHIDGKWKEQLMLLQQVKPLLEDHTIVVISMEHAPDINITEMVQFYTDLNYKTFMLGMRQLTRIDNLCPEVLENALEHPNMVTTSHETNMLLFHRLAKDTFAPPFFVAMPKGRHAKEEMTIQHMYDLFSGYGGGGQVKTANDRKAPTKK